MSDFVNSSFLVDKHFNDFGPHVSPVAPVGKTEVTILDNLYHIAQLIHGRILSSSSISGGFRVYIPKYQLKELIRAYQSIASYKLTSDIGPLIASLRGLLGTTGSELEIGIDSRIILQMIAVHNGISTNMRGIWEGVVGLRILSQSGFNKDVTLDGKQQSLNVNLAKFSESEMQMIMPEFERAGQLAGIRGPRQIDAKDMVADLLFSRKDSYVTLHELFYSMNRQRTNLRQFRTDILFCPVERLRELDAGLTIRIVPKVTKEASSSSTVISPGSYTNCEFVLKNRGLEDVKLSIAGSIGSGKLTLGPLQEIRATGTSLTIKDSDVSKIGVLVLADVREYVGVGGSIVSTTIKGKLSEDIQMTNIFFQVIRPVLPYLSSLVKRCSTSDVLRLCISKMSPWVQTVFRNLKPGSLYAGWLLTDKSAEKERILYIYLLTMMLPEFLLDPTFTFSDSVGTPPYVHEYSSFAQSLKTLYE